MSRSRTFAGSRLFIAAIGLVAVAALAAGAPDISGTWTASFDSQVGKQDYTYTLKIEGGKLTGHAKSNLGEGEITDGKVDKDMVTFIEHLNYQGMMLDITYTGKIVSADEIQFKRDVGGQGGEEFSAKRKKDKM
jgi:hypothetical protein